METPHLHRLPENERRAILRSMRLAQELGAETATLSDTAPEHAILRYAREHNLGKILLGRRQREARRLRWPGASFVDRLARLGPDLDLLIVAVEDRPSGPRKTIRARSAKSGGCRSRVPGGRGAVRGDFAVR